jgi:hypothetical protein
VKVAFTWKVTGWFMIGWSAEFSASEVRPLRYFGGKVVGDCVACPFHGWRWGPTAPTDLFDWHQPDGNEPHWEMPDLFHKFPQFDTDADAYIEHPTLSKGDAKPYMAMRKWATQLYEVPASV